MSRVVDPNKKINKKKTIVDYNYNEYDVKNFITKEELITFLDHNQKINVEEEYTPEEVDTILPGELNGNKIEFGPHNFYIIKQTLFPPTYTRKYVSPDHIKKLVNDFEVIELKSIVMNNGFTEYSEKYIDENKEELIKQFEKAKEEELIPEDANIDDYLGKGMGIDIITKYIYQIDEDKFVEKFKFLEDWINEEENENS